MLLARNINGTGQPYFDEQAILTVSPVAAPVTIVNRIFRNWTTACLDTAPMIVNLTSSLASGPAGPVDISTMFSGRCGIFNVSIAVRNSSGPAGHSTCYVIAL